MNQIFNIKRFGLLLKTEIRSASRNYYAISLGTLVGMAFLTYIVNIGGRSPIFPVTAIYGMMFALYMLIPFLLYKNLYHRKKGMTYAMIPASQFEKVLLAILQTAVIMPLVIFIMVGLCLLAINVLLAEVVDWDFGQFLSFYWDTIAAQSIFFLGVFWFKYRKVAKTFLSLLIVICALTVVVVSLYKLGIINSMSLTMEDFNEKSLSTIIYILCPLVPWVLSFIKFQRTQI